MSIQPGPAETSTPIQKQTQNVIDRLHQDYFKVFEKTPHIQSAIDRHYFSAADKVIYGLINFYKDHPERNRQTKPEETFYTYTSDLIDTASTADIPVEYWALFLKMTNREDLRTAVTEAFTKEHQLPGSLANEKALDTFFEDFQKHIGWEDKNQILFNAASRESGEKERFAHSLILRPKLSEYDADLSSSKKRISYLNQVKKDLEPSEISLPSGPEVNPQG